MSIFTVSSTRLMIHVITDSAFLVIHWPVAFVHGDQLTPLHPSKKGFAHLDLETPYVETWKAVHALLKTGKVKAVGVSNLNHKVLKAVVDESGIVPVRCIDLFPTNSLTFEDRLSSKSRHTLNSHTPSSRLTARRRTLSLLPTLPSATTVSLVTSYKHTIS